MSPEEARAWAKLYGMPDLTDEERRARTKDLKQDLRPWADIFTARYTAYRTQFNDDDSKAFQAMIMYLQVGMEMGHYDADSLLAMVAFLARRLSRATPLLIHSRNN